MISLIQKALHCHSLNGHHFFWFGCFKKLWRGIITSPRKCVCAEWHFLDNFNLHLFSYKSWKAFYFWITGSQFYKLYYTGRMQNKFLRIRPSALLRSTQLHL